MTVHPAVAVDPEVTVHVAVRPAVGAVVLAAGGGSRFSRIAPTPADGAGGLGPEPAAAGTPGGPASRSSSAGHKLLAPFRGRPVVAWALDAALAAGVERTWLVTGAVDLSDVVPPGVEVLHNPAWVAGQATSLAVAVGAALAAGLDALVVGLGDQPLVPAGAWRAVAAADAPIAVATYDGIRRNPVRLGRQVWEELPASGDEGARVLIRRRPDLVREVACVGDPADIDTVEDLQRWN